MKKQLLFTTLIMMGWGAYSQVGIGTLAPSKSSQLDVVSDKKGILIPRVSLQNTKDTVTIDGGNVNSLLVFNTSSNSDLKPGYYYWYTDSWKRVLNAADVIDKNTVNEALEVVKDDLVLKDDNGGTVSVPLKKINIITSLVNNNDGTYTYTNEAGDEVTIDIPSDVIHNFEQIVTNENVLNQLVENLLQTKVGGNVTYDGNQFTYVDGNGDTKIINIKDLVKSNETITTLRDNGDGTFTYFNESDYNKEGNLKPGATGVLFNANTLTITEASGVYTFTDASGAELAQIDTNANAVIFNDTVTQLGAEDVQTAIEKLLTKITTIENTQGDLSGTGILINGNPGEAGALLKDVVLSIADGAITTEKLADAAVTPQKIAAGNAGEVLITDTDGTVKWADASNENIKELVKSNETITTLRDNGDGTFTYFNESDYDKEGNLNPGATGVLFNANTLTITEASGVYTFTDASGAELAQIDTNANAVIFNDTVTQLGAEDVQTAIEKLLTKITTIENTQGDLSGTGILINGNPGEAGALLKDVVLSIADGAITTEKLADAAVTPQKIAAGNAGEVLITDTDGTVKWADASNENIKELVKSNETITTLRDNGDGTFTYFNELDYDKEGNLNPGATGVLFNANTLTITEASGVYTFTDASGAELAQIDTNANAIIFNDTVTQLGAEDVQTAIEKLLTKITTIENTQGDLSGTGILINGNPGEAGALLKDVVLSIADGAITTEKLADSAVTPQKIAAGNAGEVLITDTDGTVKWADASNENIKELVKSNETITTLRDNGDGTFTYFNESDYDKEGNLNPGATGVLFNANTLTITEASGVYTFTDASGAELAQIDTNANAVIFNDTVTQLGAEDVQTAIEKLLTKITTIENTQGDLSGTGILINGNPGEAGALLKDVVLSIADGAITTEKLADSAVTPQKIAAGNAGEVLITDTDGTVKWADASNENIKELVKSNETITTLRDNGDGTFTYFNESDYDKQGNLNPGATGVLFNANTLTITEASGVYTFTDASGEELAQIDTNANAVIFNDTVTQLGAEDVQTAIEKLLTKITTIENTQGDLSGTGILINGNPGEAGALLKDVVLSIADGAITTEKLADSAVTPQKIAAGNAGEVLITDTDGTVKWADASNENIKELVKSNETITTLRDNGDGTFTYFNESDYDKEGNLNPGATGVLFNANTLTITEASGVYTFTDASGAELAQIDTNANAVIFNDTVTQLGAEDVQTAIEKLLTKITTIENTQGDLSGTGILINGNPGEAGALLKDVVLSIADGAITTEKLADAAVTPQKIAAGNAGEVLITDTDGTVKWADASNENIKELVKSNETITTLRDNGDGTFTYFNESDYDKQGNLNPGATGVLFNANTLTITEASGVYTFTDASGAELAQIDTNANAIIFNDTVTQLGAEDVQTAIEKLLTKITTIENTQGDLSGTGILINGNPGEAGALLKDVVLSIADGAITTEKLADAAVTPQKIAAGNAGEVLITDTDGTVKWEEQSNVVESNQKTTSVVAGNTNVEITSSENGKNTEYKVFVKEAMPKFFYMPAIIFDTTTEGSFTRNLYDEYKAQFTGTSNPPLVASQGATVGIPVLDADELEFYVTYYDTDVFENLSIDANGVLSYDVINGATEGSYMNIVFVVK